MAAAEQVAFARNLRKPLYSARPAAMVVGGFIPHHGTSDKRFRPAPFPIATIPNALLIDLQEDSPIE
jgi:hypothetical protein